jgi:hypothetical protein
VSERSDGITDYCIQDRSDSTTDRAIEMASDRAIEMAAFESDNSALEIDQGHRVKAAPFSSSQYLEMERIEGGQLVHRGESSAAAGAGVASGGASVPSFARPSTPEDAASSAGPSVGTAANQGATQASSSPISDSASNERNSVAASDDDFVNTLSPGGPVSRKGEASSALSPPSPYPSRFDSRYIASPTPLDDVAEEEVEVDDFALRKELDSPLEDQGQKKAGGAAE